jgi:glutaredoxin
MADKELIVYSRTAPCPDCELARRVLDENGVHYREVMIDHDPEARARVESLTGFRAVPTLVVARPGELLPMSEPRPLAPGRSPRGVDRGPVITEPDAIGLRHWLTAHGFILPK